MFEVRSWNLPQRRDSRGLSPRDRDGRDQESGRDQEDGRDQEGAPLEDQHQGQVEGRDQEGALPEDRRQEQEEGVEHQKSKFCLRDSKKRCTKSFPRKKKKLKN